MPFNISGRKPRLLAATARAAPRSSPAPRRPPADRQPLRLRPAARRWPRTSRPGTTTACTRPCPTPASRTEPTGWTLTGGAGVVAGNEPWKIGGASHRNALDLPAGSSAITAPICIDETYPHFRLFARNAGSLKGALKIEVLYFDTKGKVINTKPYDYKTVLDRPGSRPAWSASTSSPPRPPSPPRPSPSASPRPPRTRASRSTTSTSTPAPAARAPSRHSLRRPSAGGASERQPGRVTGYMHDTQALSAGRPGAYGPGMHEELRRLLSDEARDPGPWTTAGGPDLRYDDSAREQHRVMADRSAPRRTLPTARTRWRAGIRAHDPCARPGLGVPRRCDRQRRRLSLRRLRQQPRSRDAGRALPRHAVTGTGAEIARAPRSDAREPRRTPSARSPQRSLGVRRPLLATGRSGSNVNTRALKRAQRAT